MDLIIIFCREEKTQIPPGALIEAVPPRSPSPPVIPIDWFYHYKYEYVLAVSRHGTVVLASMEVALKPCRGGTD